LFNRFKNLNNGQGSTAIRNTPVIAATTFIDFFAIYYFVCLLVLLAPNTEQFLCRQ